MMIDDDDEGLKEERSLEMGGLVWRRVLNPIITIFSDCCSLQLGISYDPGWSWDPSPFAVWLLQRTCAGCMYFLPMFPFIYSLINTLVFYFV